MGQTLRVFSQNFPNFVVNSNTGDSSDSQKLPDLASWPPELSLNVLKNLNATELCLAACVWQELARDQLLWQSLCHSEWPYTSIYQNKKESPDFSYHKLYLTLDEATVTFNADCHLGMNYFIKNDLIEDSPIEIAKLFFHSKPLDREQIRHYIKSDLDVLEPLVQLFNFHEQSLCDALRQYFNILEVPNRYDHYLHTIVEKFAFRYVQCNPQSRFTSESIYVLCFSLIMLSADLYNPQIKNKMSKREFIRNVRRALRVTDDEYYGHLYDDVYLKGHIASAGFSGHHFNTHSNSSNHHRHNRNLINHSNQRFHLIRTN